MLHQRRGRNVAEQRDDGAIARRGVGGCCLYLNQKEQGDVARLCHSDVDGAHRALCTEMSSVHARLKRHV